MDAKWKKNFVTNGPPSSLIIVIAKTESGVRRDGASAFVVEKHNPGVHVGRKDDKMGMRAAETSELVFESCHVPSANVLGEIGQGFHQVMHVLGGGRIAMASLGLGIAKRSLAIALQYASQRYQFQKPIMHFQGVCFQLAELATKIEAAQALIKTAIEAHTCNEITPKLIAMAKLFASELAVEATHVAMQILGGYGYMKNTPLEKYYRDAKLCTIGEGTSEIQKVIITKALQREKVSMSQYV